MFNLFYFVATYQYARSHNVIDFVGLKLARVIKVQHGEQSLCHVLSDFRATHWQIGPLEVEVFNVFKEVLQFQVAFFFDILLERIQLVEEMHHERELFLIYLYTLVIFRYVLSMFHVRRLDFVITMNEDHLQECFHSYFLVKIRLECGEFIFESAFS